VTLAGHDGRVRITIRLDDDVASSLRQLARREGRSLSRVVNDLLRAGLRTVRSEHRPAPYEPTTFDSGRPRIDVTDVVMAAEQLDGSRPG
jgi:plasmid stability protein